MSEEGEGGGFWEFGGFGWSEVLMGSANVAYKLFIRGEPGRAQKLCMVQLMCHTRTESANSIAQKNGPPSESQKPEANLKRLRLLP